MSAALLSSSILRTEVGDAMDVYLDIASSIGAIILSLLFCHSGVLMAAFLFIFFYFFQILDSKMVAIYILYVFFQAWCFYYIIMKFLLR